MMSTKQANEAWESLLTAHATLMRGFSASIRPALPAYSCYMATNSTP